jgi:hypothetical protein
MRRKAILLFSFLLVLAMAASAQTKISGTNQCAKPDPQHMIQVRDRPDHSLGLGQSKCTWTKPLEIAGIASKAGVATFSMEIAGNTHRNRGYYVDEMANGDKAHYRYQGTGTLKDGMIQSEEGTWTFIRGTGKLKGIKAKGTYKGKANPDGTITYEIEGEYEAPK